MTVSAQTPPDPYGDPDNPNSCIVPNEGQVVNDQGEPFSD